ncbi:hypothetical protein OJF2_70960 [Aquisphaera giovannonii]|uniref:Uncharacterized protein n=1 Tax=Aquisphaera giovannonii TaxID=406548 RepID=A0A5B9WDE8_9BACT|nr:hypothetical protein [Aquisphaera giovannonii]QEH38493.1 hypothetical protein OJF2_70960 [Aquisphaera giovannonii]
MSPWHVVPDEWKPRLRAHLRATRGEDRDRLSAQDFRGEQSVHLTFADGSFALFRYAFAILDEAGERCIVFTEHCGYHVFPVGADGVEIMRTVSPQASPDAAPAPSRGEDQPPAPTAS